MNICFFMGKIIGGLKFCFTLLKDPVSIIKFTILLPNDSELIVYAFNEVADNCYKKMKLGDWVFVSGCLTKNYNKQVVCYAEKILKY